MKKLALAISLISILLTSMTVIAAHGEAGLSGKVVETMDSGGYTYAQIENNGSKTWVAVPQTTIKKGQTVSFKPGMSMSNFKSKTLNRTFDHIVFSEGLMQ